MHTFRNIPWKLISNQDKGCWSYFFLTHCGRVTHICVSKLTIIGSDNGLSPDRRQALIWTNAGILLVGPLGTNFSEILIKILILSFKKLRLKVSSAKRWPFCLGLNVEWDWEPTGKTKNVFFFHYTVIFQVLIVNISNIVTSSTVPYSIQLVISWWLRARLQ